MYDIILLIFQLHFRDPDTKCGLVSLIYKFMKRDRKRK